MKLNLIITYTVYAHTQTYPYVSKQMRTINNNTIIIINNNKAISYNLQVI